MKRFLAIFFSFLILSSSGGVVMAKHFCGGELVETAFFEELHSCCEGMDMPTPCCELEHEVVQHDDNTQISFQSVDPPEQVLLYTITYPSLVRVVIRSTFIDNTYLLHPLTVPDRLTRYQSFLL
ncbi:MAG: hypothetical protein R8N23_19970 [Reichenbachiella sp.]|uniref:HYC_CC_PP family protein n=1 Tax=Reichenbachiella sp. TaxID=2184521 RepID=UPI002966815C|nr:hypothetical protein [Reichenbachiella sp.]MDW3212157.1 hypothetical protein [Reichenbachiella sp.]